MGSEQGGVRPVLIIQNDIGNRFSPTVIVAAITAQIQKAKLPTHVEVKADKHGLEKDSVILLEQIRTLDKQRLTDRITKLDDEMMAKVDRAIEISLGIGFKNLYGDMMTMMIILKLKIKKIPKHDEGFFIWL